MDKKVTRILDIYSRLLDGKVIVKSKEAVKFGVTDRTIQRDLDDIRAYLLYEPEIIRELVYDRRRKGYVLVQGGK